jgi:hypothetical protein
MPVSQPRRCRAICGTHYRPTLPYYGKSVPMQSLRSVQGIPPLRQSEIWRAQAPRSSLLSLVQRAGSRRWIGFESINQSVDARPNVCSHLPLGPSKRPAGLGFTQCRLRHTRLALTAQRIGDFLLRGLLHMLWSPSSFEERVSGVCRDPSISSHTIWCALSLPPKRRTCTSMWSVRLVAPHCSHF